MWELLWTLADRALIRRKVDCDLLSNPKLNCSNTSDRKRKPPSVQAVKDRRSDLKKLIVPELNELIVDTGAGTYKLNLDASDICLLGWFNEEKLGILQPGVGRSLVKSLIEPDF